MPSPTFDELITNPIGDNPYFSSFCSSANFFVNLTYYIVYAVLAVFIAYNLFQTVYKITSSDEEETYKKFQEGVVNAFLAALAIIVITSAAIIPVNVLRLTGVPDEQNIFIKGTTCPSDPYADTDY